MEDLFVISTEDIQYIAKRRIGRELSHNELVRVKDGLNAGLESWEFVAFVAIDDVMQDTARE